MKKEQERSPRQSEFNLATINGEQVLLPHDDLYIPPNALKIFLESFEGPLDLLLYFIRKQNLDEVGIEDLNKYGNEVLFSTINEILKFKNDNQ